MKRHGLTKLLSVSLAMLLMLAAVTSVSADPLRIASQNRPRPMKPKVSTSSADIVITGDLTTLTPQALAQSLVGPGISISNVTANCDVSAAGMFTTTGYTGVGLNAGIVMSSGKIVDVVGPNDAAGKSTGFGLGGDADLDTILAAGTGSKDSHDACVLEFDFIPTSSTVAFDYVFGSEEYNEFVNTAYNDVFGFFINGVNCAVIEDSPVSINALNDGNPGGTGGPNSDYYIDNEGAGYNTQLDGLTQTLTCSTQVNPGVVNHVKLAVADAGDSILDSAVFIGAGSFVSSDYLGKVSPTYSYKRANNLSTVTYTLPIKNVGALTDTFDVVISGNAWPTVFADNRTTTTRIGPLSSLETAYVYPEVTIPRGVYVTDTAVITVTSLGSGVVNPAISTAYVTTAPNGSDLCQFVREVPNGYIAGIPMPVTIKAIPTCVFPGRTFTLEDTVPTGWTVTNISDGGVVANGTITWPPMTGKEITVSYVVTPPLAESADVTFTGVGIADTQSFAVTGKTTSKLNTAANHPADKDKDDTVSLGEFSLYSTYWKAGRRWPYGWNPISAGFVTRAGEIWSRGLGYTFDVTTAFCPDCWMAGGISPAFDLTTSLSRIIPAKYIPGQPVAVSLVVTPPSSSQAYAVEDAPPAGWAISGIDSNGSFDGNTRKIKWGVFKDAATVPSRTLSYTATPPANYSGDKLFSALASFDGVDKAVSTVITTDVKLITVESAYPDSMYNGYGPTTITLTGSGFTTGASVVVNGTGVTAGPATVLDSTTLTVPITVDLLATPGIRTITVTTPDSTTGTSVGIFTVKFTPPIIPLNISSKPLTRLLSHSGSVGVLTFAADPSVDVNALKLTLASDAWIQLDANSLRFAFGKGSINYTVLPNATTDARTGTIRVGTADYIIFQAGVPCSLTASFSDTVVPAAGKAVTLTVNVTPDTCKWNVVSASGTDGFFADSGNFPAISLESITGDQTYSGIVGATARARALKVKLETVDGKGKKVLTLRQSAR